MDNECHWLCFLVCSSGLGQHIFFEPTNLWRRWNWDTLEIQCDRTCLIERCSKLGLLLRKSPKRNSQWRKRKFGFWFRFNTKAYVSLDRCSPPGTAPVDSSLQDTWIGSKNTESVISDTQVWALWISFQYRYHLRVTEAMAMGITGMVVNCSRVLPTRNLESLLNLWLPMFLKNLIGSTGKRPLEEDLEFLANMNIGGSRDELDKWKS